MKICKKMHETHDHAHTQHTRMANKLQTKHTVTHTHTCSCTHAHTWTDKTQLTTAYKVDYHIHATLYHGQHVSISIPAGKVCFDVLLRAFYVAGDRLHLAAKHHI